MDRTEKRLDDGSAADALDLVVISGGALVVHHLPRSGTVSIGRSQENEVSINDASVSRRHAVLHLGPPLRIQDLGGANGVRLRDIPDAPETAPFRETRLAAGGIMPIRVGDSIALGSAVIVVRHRDDVGPPAPAGDGGFVVRDEAMCRLHELAAKVAEGNISALLLGETGTGKEVLAEVIHKRSPRASRPFLGLNCAALAESVLESELFGHERGAFTGAVQSKPGLLETAAGGTVFLDEVGDLPPATQVKLLRVLEERSVMRVGGLAARPIDVRFISATNCDLDECVRRGTFRRDLFYRLDGITLRIPPLRERRAEIEPLARLFAARAAAAMGRPAPILPKETIAALERHAWPGNLRELRNVMDRAVVLAAAAPLLEEHLLLAPASEAPVADARGPSAAPARDDAGSLQDELEGLERRRIIDALKACAGNQTQAAAMLGMPRRTFVARLDEYGIPRPRKKTR